MLAPICPKTNASNEKKVQKHVSHENEDPSWVYSETRRREPDFDDGGSKLPNQTAVRSYDVV